MMRPTYESGFGNKAGASASWVRVVWVRCTAPETRGSTA